MKKTVDKIKYDLEYFFKTRGKKAHTIIIDKIPDEWECFPYSKGSWVRADLKLPYDHSSCLYKGLKGEIMDLHVHPNVESIFLLTPDTSITVYSHKKKKKVVAPNGIIIEKELPHFVELHDNMILLIIWTPSFKDGYNAQFANEKQKK